MKKLLLSASLLLTVAVSAMAEESAVFSYAGNDEALQSWGYNKQETYDIAIFINDPALVGKTITKLAVPYREYGGSEFSMWLSSELKVSQRKNVPDICSQAAEFKGTDLQITLDEPYTIPQEGVYVGYTFTTSLSNYPVVTVAKTIPGSFWVHAAKTQLSWKDLSERENQCSTIKVTLEGEFEPYSVALTNLPDVMDVENVEYIVPAKIQNQGLNPISSISYTVNNGSGADFENTIELKTPIAPRYLEYADVNLPLGEFKKVGDNPYTLTITGINGEDNVNDNRSAEGHVHITSTTAVCRPLLEDYTSFGCGFCTRGFAAMERMHRLYPDRFVAASFHREDQLTITGSFPVPVAKFDLPTAFMNRTVECDPYFGISTAGGGFYIEDYWKQQCEVPVGMNIDVTAAWLDDEKTQLRATSYTTFLRAPDQNYRVAYILTADGLQDYSWIQSNYYSGDKTPGFIEEMNQFTSGAAHIPGFVYDDVVVMFTPMEGEDPNFPQNPQINVINTHNHIFNINEAVNLQGANIIQNKDKLNVIAMVVAEGGRVVNCNITPVSNTLVDQAVSVNPVVETIFFDAAGNRIAEPKKGLVIRTNIYSDGTKSTTKIIL